MTNGTEVLISGTGATGLAAALALSRLGFRVTLAGPRPATSPGRTVALLEGSLRLFDALGVGAEIEAASAPLAVMRIIDDTSSLFRPPPLQFAAAELGLGAFGRNVANDDLVAILANAVARAPNLVWIAQPVVSFANAGAHSRVQLADGNTLDAALLMAADGRTSVVRKAAGITVRTQVLPQAAVTAVLRHDRPHGDISTEFHTRAGPFTLVPLPARPPAPHRSSLVWVSAPRDATRLAATDDATFARAVETQAHRLLGRVEVEGARGLFRLQHQRATRLVAGRVALVGEAAHVMPPIAAQGLNLALRDVAQLADCLEGVSLDEPDDALARYATLRLPDIGSRMAGVAALNRSLLLDLAPADFLRGLGLVALGAIGPLRRLAMREGLMPRGPIPRLMRAKI